MANYLDADTPIYEAVVRDLDFVPNAGRVTAPVLPAGTAMILASVERAPYSGTARLSAPGIPSTQKPARRVRRQT